VNFLRFFVTGLLSLPLLARAAELRVDMSQGSAVYRTEALLQRPDLRAITIPDDVAFHGTMRYRAVPLTALLPGIGIGDNMQFTALDGFVAEIPASLLLQRGGSQAWLAIDDPAHPWPALGGGQGSAGPFYVVWTRPRAGNINPEQWPYQVAAIRVLPAAGARFPAIQPADSLPSDSPVRRGFAVFQRTCFACHTLNGEGAATLGPDLNLPYSPTEYLRADLLRGFIRNPQSLRQWPQARMPAFSKATLPDADLDAVLDYLRHMAGRRRSGEK
jgi:mono/diheme cytochrome c family protein